MHMAWIHKILLLGVLTTATAAVDFTGRYDTNWGELELRQKGNTVSGIYFVPAPGEIEGVIRDDTLVYRWLQSNGVWGMGRFRLSADRKLIEGPWGTGKSPDNGGVWSGQRKP